MDDNEATCLLASFKQELQATINRFEQELEASPNSPATLGNAILQLWRDVAGALDSMYGTDQFSSAIERLTSEAFDELVSRNRSRLKKRDRLNVERLAILADAFERNLIAADVLPGDHLPGRPGMESAYTIAAKARTLVPKSELPIVSRDAVEKRRFRLAKANAPTQPPRFVHVDPISQTFSDSDGIIAELLSRLPKKGLNSDC